MISCYCNNKAFLEIRKENAQFCLSLWFQCTRTRDYRNDVDIQTCDVRGLMFLLFFTLVHRIQPVHVLRVFVSSFSLFAFSNLEMLKLAYRKFDSSAIKTQHGCLVRLWHPHKTEDEKNPKQLLVYPTVTKHARTRTVELKAFFFPTTWMHSFYARTLLQSLFSVIGK